MAENQGYQCEFLDTIPEDFYCKKCALVARRLSLTSCCAESFCQTCIAQGEPCPECGKKEFTTLQHVKNQKKIKSLQAYCSMKERGCVWSGTLDQLDTHLDPHLDNCQYVDTKCPLNCLQTVPKNKVDQHVAQECTKRPHVCQHCGFKATYEEVVDTHLPECKYVALQCPNMCGVSCEREVMEDHMKICRLEEVECEFSSVGCDGRFIREDQDEHARQNSQKHLTLTASLAVETKEQLQQKLLEQDMKHVKEEEKLKKKIQEQEEKLEEQTKKLEELENKLAEQDKVINKMAENNDTKLKKLEGILETYDDRIKSILYINRKFVMENFSIMNVAGKKEWSPAMYTRIGGYKFCIQVEVSRHGKYISVYIHSMAGEFDEQLNWPARVKFSIELINQQGKENAKCTSDEITWGRPMANEGPHRIGVFKRTTYQIYWIFIETFILAQFLDNGALHFCLSKVDVLNL